MESNKQPVKEVPPQPRYPTSPPASSSTLTPACPAHSVKHTTGSLQHVQVASSVVGSFTSLKPPERDQTLLSSMKSVKTLRQAGITAVFTGQNRADSEGRPQDHIPIEEVIQADIDTLVPTHDENGQPIAEWKRQVMVHQLRARLQQEEEQRVKDIANGYSKTDGWKFSLAHNAILGPFGELLTEDDLLYLEKQIENMSMQKRCQAYEHELVMITEELRTILPDPVVHIKVNTEFIQQMDAEGHLPLPVWCSRVSGIVKSMYQLLTNHSTDRDEGVATEAVGVGQRVEAGTEREVSKLQRVEMVSAFSYRLESQSYNRGRREKVEMEIQQSGVSVKSLRSNFEGQIGGMYPFGGFVSDTCRPVNRSQPTKVAVESAEAVVQTPNTTPGCELGQGCQTRSNSKRVTETTSLRKERIVVLFLSHWKKSAYAISVRAKMRQEAIERAEVVVDTLRNSSQVAAHKQSTNIQSGLINWSTTQPGTPQPGATHPGTPNPGTPNPGTSDPGTPHTGTSHRNISFLSLYLRKTAVDKMLKSWRSMKTSTSSGYLSQVHAINYSPEHFLPPQVDGSPMTYDCLTLDLFMLGYFHILEQELPAEERKMRHLLCFEVFDHVGGFPWEKVRDFHKAVLQEIQEGKRQWSDGFEDIKARFFGNSAVPGSHRTAGVNESQSSNMPKVIVQTATPEEEILKCSSGTDFSCFSNDEICKYIDRSFAFWKEKEAELFDFKH